MSEIEEKWSRYVVTMQLARTVSMTVMAPSQGSAVDWAAHMLHTLPVEEIEGLVQHDEDDIIASEVSWAGRVEPDTKVYEFGVVEQKDEGEGSV